MNRFSQIFFDTASKKEKLIERYPIILTFLLCIFLSSLSFMREDSISPGNLFIFLAVFVCFSFFATVFIERKFLIKRAWSVLLFFILNALALLYTTIIYNSTERPQVIFFTVLLVVAISFTFRAVTGRLTVKYGIAMVFILGLFLRFLYVLITGANERQQDVYNFGWDGHSGYIKYLYENNFALPDFDVRTRDQFYHPPLHHLIAALWWKILSAFGIANSYAQESIQTLTLFYSCVCMIISYKIMRLFKLKGCMLILAFSLIAFHPTFVMLSGSINNDMLSITFMLASIYLAMKWYKTSKLKDLLLCSLMIGLGMMTKLSAYQAAYAVAVIMLVKMFKDVVKDKKAIKKYAIHFSLFIAICAPIGLFYQFRNFILYDVPLTYVPRLSDTSQQYVGNYSFWERTFLIDPKCFSSVFEQWLDIGKVYTEYNPMVAILKTSMFGESIRDLSYPTITAPATFLFYLNMAIAILSFAAMIYVLIVKLRRKEGCIFEIAFTTLYFLMLISFYIFCFSFPHGCTQNIRYVSPLILIGAVFFGLAGQELVQIKNKKAVLSIKIALSSIVSLFAIFAVVLFLLIAWA